MADDHIHNSLPRSLGSRTDLTDRSTGAALRTVADDVAPAPAGIGLERREVRDGLCEAGRRVERTIRQLVRRGPSRVPTAHDAKRRT